MSMEGFSTAGLNRQIAELNRKSPKPIADIVNQRTLNVAGRALNETPRADKNRIIHELGEIGRNLRMSKNGRMVRGSRIFVRAFGDSGASRMALIINAARGRQGLPGLEGAEMEKAIVKALASRKRAVGFEASAWIPPVKQIAARLTHPFMIARLKGIAVYGRDKGEARPAAPGFKVQATIINNAKQIDKVGSGALATALRDESADLQMHLLSKDMKPIFDDFNNAAK